MIIKTERTSKDLKISLIYFKRKEALEVNAGVTKTEIKVERGSSNSLKTDRIKCQRRHSNSKLSLNIKPKATKPYINREAHRATHTSRKANTLKTTQRCFYVKEKENSR